MIFIYTKTENRTVGISALNTKYGVIIRHKETAVEIDIDKEDELRDFIDIMIITGLIIFGLMALTFFIKIRWISKDKIKKGEDINDSLTQYMYFNALFK